MKPAIVETAHLLLPGEANALGAAFGGSVVGWIDMCAAIAAQKYCKQSVVTASMDDLHFHAQIVVGETVQLKARVLAAFNTSVEVGVTVHSVELRTGNRTLTTSALLTFVAIDAHGNKLPVPPLELTTKAEKRAAEEAQSRRGERLARRGQGRSWVELLGA
jgi:acyl-CoA hydrolase